MDTAQRVRLTLTDRTGNGGFGHGCRVPKEGGQMAILGGVCVLGIVTPLNIVLSRP